MAHALIASPEETLIAFQGHGSNVGPAGTLRSNGARSSGGAIMIAAPLGGGNDGAGRRTEDDPNLIIDQVVRRLTPRECERLQALPDDWTLVDDAADGPRYAAIGDAVTASVAEWIGRRIIASEAAA